MFRIFLTLAMLALILIGCGNENAPEADADAAPQISGEVAYTEVGNSVCPVMGKGVVQGQYFDWEGYRIGICCPGCESAFRNSPEAYLSALLDDPAVSDEVKAGLSALVESAENGQ